MHPKSNRRVATRFTPHLTVIGLAAALSLVPLRDATAQHSGHGGHGAHSGHAGHGAHQGHAAKKPQPVKNKAVKKKRGSGANKAGGHDGMSTPRASQGGTGSATGEFQVAHERMMRNMALPYTGDADVDFRVQMIPHHQGAIDMARVAMRHAKDPWTRQLAEAVIVEQQREIAEMQAWLARRGATVPSAGQPTHILGATSFRSVPEEPGTQAELRGQSWAPGSGVPAQH